MNIDFSDVIKRIGNMNRQELEAVFSAYKMRSKNLRSETALVNQATLTPGTRVVTQNLKPKYLNGLHGVVSEHNSARRAGDITIVIDEADRLHGGRYVSPSGIVNVPAASLLREVS